MFWAQNYAQAPVSSVGVSVSLRVRGHQKLRITGLHNPEFHTLKCIEGSKLP
jgi:hypothetical protein